jgi:hypothetical protein
VQKVEQVALRFALDVAAAGPPVAVGGGEDLAGRRIEDEHGAFEAAILIGAEIGDRDVAAAEVDEEGLAAVVESAVGEDVARADAPRAAKSRPLEVHASLRPSSVRLDLRCLGFL